jgi:hypothetical protein
LRKNTSFAASDRNLKSAEQLPRILSSHKRRQIDSAEMSSAGMSEEQDLSASRVPAAQLLRRWCRTLLHQWAMKCPFHDFS